MSREQSFIAGLTRLLGVYYGIRALDQAASSIYLIQMQYAALAEQSLSEEVLAAFPNMWLMMLTTVGLYVGIAAGVFFLAPVIARAIVPEPLEADSSEGGIDWNETMIFCSGLVFIAWALSRIVDGIYAQIGGFGPAPAEQTGMMVFALLTLVILSVGIFLTVKFHQVSAWMAQRKNAYLTNQASPRG